MSSEIKGIGMLEVIIISIVIFVIAATVGMTITFDVLKKCKKNKKATGNDFMTTTYMEATSVRQAEE